MLDDATLLRFDQESHGWVAEQPKLTRSNSGQLLDALGRGVDQRENIVFLLNRNFAATVTAYQNRRASSEDHTHKPSRRVRDELHAFQAHLTIDEGEIARPQVLIAAATALSEAAWLALETGFMDDAVARRCGYLPSCRSDIASYPLELLRRITQEVVSKIRVVTGPCKPIEKVCVRALAGLWKEQTGRWPTRIYLVPETTPANRRPGESGPFLAFCRLFVQFAREAAGVTAPTQRELSAVVRAVLKEGSTRRHPRPSRKS